MATMQMTASHRPLSDGRSVVEVFSVGTDIVNLTAVYDIFAQWIRWRRDGISVSLPSVHEGLHTPRELTGVAAFQYSKTRSAGAFGAGSATSAMRRPIS